MKYLHYYETASAFTESYDGENYLEPWLSYTDETQAVNYNKPDPSNGHCYVDLGLPSGTLWGCTNIGAENPDELGTDYKWAEIEPYEYSRLYKYEDQSTGQYTKYCSTDEKTVLDLEDDIANVAWGGGWHIPTIEQVYELMDNTTRTVSGKDENNYDIYVTFTSNINGNELKFRLEGGCVTWLNECGDGYDYAWVFAYGCEGSFGPRLAGDTGDRSNNQQVRGVLGDGPEREDLVI